MNGYKSLEYANSFSEFGALIYLENCGAYILKRKIYDTCYYDAIGLYPVFSCLRSDEIGGDLDKLNDIISLMIITDSLDYHCPEYLINIFDISYKFKDHFHIDLSVDMNSVIPINHRRNIKKSWKDVDVQLCSDPLLYLDKWYELYNVLIDRHNITNISKFSKTSFKYQLSVPNSYLFKAIHNNDIVGMSIWYAHEDDIHYHLAAYNDIGYKLKVSFVMFDFIIKFFKSNGFRYLNLGAGVGIDTEYSGLTRFKSGWSTHTKPVYLCGKILNKDIYDFFTVNKANSFFPKYRDELW